MSGVSRSTVSRVISQIHYNGLIDGVVVNFPSGFNH
jgi:DNA-binding MarR family transcriptional regulator